MEQMPMQGRGNEMTESLESWLTPPIANQCLGCRGFVYSDENWCKLCLEEREKFRKHAIPEEELNDKAPWK
jgi:hypothetical protein